ncbi:hypothetical protein [Methylobacterium iners]|uniref:Uncharacterized protein n=1 Tax=Methylobacterium iners TaxID=418707 RepID=A0ABQ4S471_9HYPH|nr:hypothetical protein [Methylobacterium iners]GJD96603.1 hypothetical protein OCOJLMKI_3826 [Methylobacterium iners]
MPLNSPLYENLKGQVYDIAQIAAGRGNAEAQTEGFRDVYDLIMSDSDHPRQPAFLGLIMDRLSEKQRPILLDGLAREYAGVDSWMAYVDREE